jgi:succinyl-CoA synthetase alpha subunit
MTILVNEDTKVLVQGITGREGERVTKMMVDYGTKVEAGVTPGRGGMKIHGVPVYDTVEEAVENCGPMDASLVLVPPLFAEEAAFEAITAGFKLVILCIDDVPKQDAMRMIAYADKCGSIILGPNSPGIISPGKTCIGIFDPQFFEPGPVAVLSRSGGMTATLAFDLRKIGIGQTTCIGVGGDPVVGSDLTVWAMHAEQDKETRAIAVFGEIGTTQEERLAKLASDGRITKPIVAYIAGVTAVPGVRFSHAGAIIERGRGSGLNKIDALKNAGVHVVDTYPKVAKEIKYILEHQIG